jgi:hypothetical protein
VCATKDSITFLDEGVQAVIPKQLYQAIVRVQAAGALEWGEACVRTAELSDHGGAKFKRDVEKEARRLHNSQFMSQLNEGRGTIRTSGYNAGYEAGKNAHQTWYYCGVCGGRIWFEPNSDSHKAAIQFMKDGGWGHGKCHEQQ